MRIGNRSVFLAAIVVLFSTAAAAQSQDLIDADRPGLADSSAVVGAGRFQIETGAQWEKRGREVSAFAPTLFRAGVSNRIEARIESDTVTMIREGGARDTGIAPVSLGFKGVLRDGVGVIGRVSPPSGSGAFRAATWTADVRLVADLGLAERWSINPNAGFAWNEGASSHYASASLALTLSYAPSPAVTWFVDTAAELPEIEGGTSSVIVDAGLAHIVRQNWQFDVSAGTRAHGATGARPFVAAGLSYRFTP